MESQTTTAGLNLLGTEAVSHVVPLSRLRRLADKIGICLSAACVVHCLLTPVFLILIPSLEVTVYHEVFHEGLLMILPILALVAFVPGYRRHREARVFYWGIPGLTLVSVGALVFHDDAFLQAALSITGSLLLVRAHLINRQLCACCETGHGRRAPKKSLAVRRFRVAPAAGKGRLLRR